MFSSPSLKLFECSTNSKLLCSRPSHRTSKPSSSQSSNVFVMDVRTVQYPIPIGRMSIVHLNVSFCIVARCTLNGCNKIMRQCIQHSLQSNKRTSNVRRTTLEITIGNELLCECCSYQIKMEINLSYNLHTEPLSCILSSC